MADRTEEIAAQLQLSTAVMERATAVIEQLKGERDALAALAGGAIVRCARRPGETMPPATHALESAIDGLLAERDMGYGRVGPRLVRDLNPVRMQRPLRRAAPEELLDLIRKKVVEEAHELLAAEVGKTGSAVASEIADVLEATYALAEHLGINAHTALLKKRSERGGFTEGWVLEEEPR